jgi:hypothetical protein
MHNEYFGVALPLKNGRAFGGSIQYLGSGDVAGRDNTGQPTGDYSSRFGAYTLSYGQTLHEKLSVGISGKLIESKLADVSGMAYAADIGTLYRPLPKLSLAAVIANLGTRLTYLNEADRLPLQARLAGAYSFNAAWRATVETVYHVNDQSLAGHFGAEWQPLPAIALRAGYHTDAVSELGGMAGVTAGIGIHMWGQEFSYAWVPYGDLGDSQYFSLHLKFGGAGEGEKNLSAHANAASALNLFEEPLP